jgi:hypothetical protein
VGFNKFLKKRDEIIDTLLFGCAEIMFHSLQMSSPRCNTYDLITQRWSLKVTVTAQRALPKPSPVWCFLGHDFVGQLLKEVVAVIR